MELNVARPLKLVEPTRAGRRFMRSDQAGFFYKRNLFLLGFGQAISYCFHEWADWGRSSNLAPLQAWLWLALVPQIGSLAGTARAGTQRQRGASGQKNHAKGGEYS